MAADFEKRASEVLQGLKYRAVASEDVVVSGIAYASNRVEPGDMFFCIPGLINDGHDFALDAVSRGAAGIVCERELGLDIAQYVVDDSRAALAQCAANAYDRPSESLDVVAVTGTNGKTTTTYLVEAICAHAGLKSGIIGTVETRIGGERLHSEHTTPESSDLQAIFARMRDRGVQVCVMEASSHAIDLGRVNATSFKVAAFSQLTQDHLDYHKTMEAYYQAKRRLFFEHDVERRVVCIDDDWGVRLAKELRAAGKQVFTCGFSEEADIRAQDPRFEPRSTSFTLVQGGMRLPVTMPLIGSYNVDNALLAAAICTQLAIPPDQIAAALALSPQVPGRLELVGGEECDFSVFVDYAHTPDALSKALNAVKGITPGRTIVVFGCGGDRDRGKRPKMGAAACDADFAVVTSDNPRSEDPAAIIEDILPGMAGREGNFEVCADRRTAIVRALEHATPGDSVLIAGKGHEDYQIVGDKVLDFDDRKVATEEIGKLS